MEINDLERLIWRAEVINAEYGKISWSFHSFLDTSVKDLSLTMPTQAGALSDRLKELTIATRRCDECIMLHKLDDGWC